MRSVAAVKETLHCRRRAGAAGITANHEIINDFSPKLAPSSRLPRTTLSAIAPRRGKPAKAEILGKGGKNIAIFRDKAKTRKES